MTEKLTLYPIYAVGPDRGGEPFNAAVLPFAVMPEITVEDMSGLLGQDAFEWVRREMGGRDFKTLRSIRYAIVHRYHTEQPTRGEDDLSSEKLLREIAACLRLIRPMRQSASLIQGAMTPDRGLDVQHFEHPIHLLNVPPVQRLFHLRNRDLDSLREIAPPFLAAMNGDYWKIRMAVQYHDAGHWEDRFWKPRFSLWMAGLEALYTSPDSDHSGRLVTTERVKHFLGPNTNIYDPGDIPSYLAQPQVTVGEALTDVYRLRNYVIHGERVPEEYGQPRRQGVNGPEDRISVLIEALSFILRKSILRVLRENLAEDFRDAAASRRYWRALSLTRPLLLGREAVVKLLRIAVRPLAPDEITNSLNNEAQRRVRLLTQDMVTRYLEAAVKSGQVVATEGGSFAIA